MDQGWKHVVVLGAAGKMGSGIALLLLQEMATVKESVLTLLDTNPKSFTFLKKYLRDQLTKYAERNINRLRKTYQDVSGLVDNEDMIRVFVEEGLDRVRFVTSIEECRGARMVFEAIVEDIEIKADVLARVDDVADGEAIYFSNTSSIPIHVLEERSGIKGRIVGFHFYNPPAVQKLLELIIPAGTKKDVVEKVLEVARLLNKTTVFSEDIAGFIGNGHFIREVSEACTQVEQLCEEMPLFEAICTVNTITQEFLVRPMGMFQLMDYVGIDVVRHIAKIMTEYLPGQAFNTVLIDQMLQAGIRGGQHADGSQKEGFFIYEKGKPVKVYDSESHTYVPYRVAERYHALPKGHESWKTMSKDKDRKSKLQNYFVNLLEESTLPAKLAVRFLEHSRLIGQGLVKDGVARSIEDVDVVLQNGFFHLYGVEEPWTATGVNR